MPHFPPSLLFLFLSKPTLLFFPLIPSFLFNLLCDHNMSLSSACVFSSCISLSFSHYSFLLFTFYLFLLTFLSIAILSVDCFCLSFVFLHTLRSFIYFPVLSPLKYPPSFFSLSLQTSLLPFLFFSVLSVSFLSCNFNLSLLHFLSFPELLSLPFLSFAILSSYCFCFFSFSFQILLLTFISFLVLFLSLSILCNFIFSLLSFISYPVSSLSFLSLCNIILLLFLFHLPFLSNITSSLHLMSGPFPFPFSPLQFRPVTPSLHLLFLSFSPL